MIAVNMKTFLTDFQINLLLGYKFMKSEEVGMSYPQTCHFSSHMVALTTHFEKRGTDDERFMAVEALRELNAILRYYFANNSNPSISMKVKAKKKPIQSLGLLIEYFTHKAVEMSDDDALSLLLEYVSANQEEKAA